jgi:hypothetical protein
MIALLIATFLATARAERLELRTLSKECRLERSWFGVVQSAPHAVWLVCGGQRFFVTGPNSLVSHVRLSTPGDALEFVRFFTSADRGVRPGGMIEIVPGGDDDPRLGTVPKKQFDEHFSAASVEDLGRSKISKLRSFAARRPVFLPSGEAAEVLEIVREDGYYEIESQTTILKDASPLGLIYLEH